MQAAHPALLGITLGTRLGARVITAMAILGLAAACRVDAPVAADDRSAVPTKAFSNTTAAVDGRYIVVFRDSVADLDGTTTRLVRRSNAALDRTYGRALKGFSATMSDAAVDELSRDPAVAFIEQDRLVTAHGIQSPAPWATDRIDQREMALSGSYSWERLGSGVNVYILDSGIRTTHTQFGGRASSAYGAFGDGWDNGDCNGHGTYVAGLVGSWNYGAAKGANLHSVRVLDCTAVGTTTSVIAGLNWLVANRVLPAVANMSFGLPNSPALNQAVQNLLDAGVTVTTSAGNTAIDACTLSPASVAGALTVAAAAVGDAMPSWSNRGTCIDLFAPGVQVYSTSTSHDNATTITDGSSASAALAAGAAAMYLEENPSASPAAVWNALVSDATPAMRGVPVGMTVRLLYTGPAGSTPPPPPPPTDAAPKASLTVSCRKLVCTFDGSTSTDDRGIVSYVWSYGDGTSSETTTTATRSHTYARAATYTATLTVKDAAGQTAQASVTVKLKGR